jgi:nucleoside-diphosphate-sugar epimerase
MKILVIGGSGFIGPFIIRELVRQGHEVTLVHRGQAKPVLPGSVQRIPTDRNHLRVHRKKFDRLAADAVIDVILSDERQAKDLMENFRGVTARIVALSSQDVYLWSAAGDRTGSAAADTGYRGVRGADKPAPV